jgi:hypothetical protein
MVKQGSCKAQPEVRFFLGAKLITVQFFFLTVKKVFSYFSNLMGYRVIGNPTLFGGVLVHGL